jgi:hypothetical protein
VILCTGFSEKITQDRASEIGIQSLAYKPFDKKFMAKTIRRVLDGAK